MTQPVALVGPLDRILFFRTLPAFDGLPASALGAIAQSAREAFFSKGSLLLDPNTPAEAFYVIVDGEAEIDRAGVEATVAGPGEAIGFVQLLARSAAGVGVRATRDTLTLELDWEDQLDICEQHFPVLVRYLRYLARRLLVGDRRGAVESRVIEPEWLPARALTFTERLFILRRCPAFPPTMLDAIAELARHVTEVRFQRGDGIWAAGDRADRFLVIAAGEVEVARSHQRVSRLGAGGTIGLLEAFAGTPRLGVARAEQPVIALQVELEPFLDILEDHFDLALGMMQLLAHLLLEQEGARD